MPRSGEAEHVEKALSDAHQHKANLKYRKATASSSAAVPHRCVSSFWMQIASAFFLARKNRLFVVVETCGPLQPEPNSHPLSTLQLSQGI